MMHDLRMSLRVEIKLQKRRNASVGMYHRGDEQEIIWFYFLRFPKEAIGEGWLIA